jgi:predicted nucleic acid-binding protein
VIVVDSSVVLEVLLRSRVASQIEERVLLSGETLHAPHILDLEVAQVLRRYAVSTSMKPERGLEALADLADLPITRYPHNIFLPRLWELRHNLTAYDAAYVALAEALPALLLTRDARLASTSGHEAAIGLI